MRLTDDQQTTALGDGCAVTTGCVCADPCCPLGERGGPLALGGRGTDVSGRVRVSAAQIRLPWQFAPTLEGGCVPPSDGRNA